jgi:osmotically-inducible protein OsmY
VLQALMLDSVIPSTVGAAVRAGLVILLGTAQWQFQRREAEFVAANVLGVVGIENSIRLRAAVPTAHDVEHSIMRALGRDCLLAGRTLSVRGSDGVVTLRGTIASWAERDAAVDAAWAAPGVIHVNDRLTVR